MDWFLITPLVRMTALYSPPPGQAGIGTTPQQGNNPDYVNREPVPQGTPLGGIATLIPQTLVKVVETKVMHLVLTSVY